MLSNLLDSLISIGVTTVEIIMQGTATAHLYAKENGGWRFHCSVDYKEVVTALKNATNQVFCANKLIDRLKIPSATLGNDIGSAVLRYCPANESSEAQVTLSGLRFIR